MCDWDGRCQRCYKETNGYTMSYFSTALICFECDDKERKHDKFKDAVAANEAAIKGGNTNFAGIGEPGDL